jgi:hypothetical protein
MRRGDIGMLFALTCLAGDKRAEKAITPRATMRAKDERRAGML